MRAVVNLPTPVPTTINLVGLTVEELEHLVICTGQACGPTGLYDALIDAWQRATGNPHHVYPKGE